MIDTINLRIHNLSEYKTIYNQFYTNGKNAITEAIIDKETGEVLENHKIHSIIFHDSNNILPLSQRNSFTIPSSHYSVSYFINQGKQTLDINISLPKMKFSTNILQLINFYDTSAIACYNQLLDTIDKFFKTYFLQIPAKKDVEIVRLDLCYNQFFESQNQSLVYLEEQKKILQNFARSSRNNFRTYDTSWMYITQRYSFKCYHKGDEFLKNDFKKLQKNNPLNHHLGKLVEESSKILRYELTCRPSYFKYLVAQNFFESENAKKIMKNINHPVAKFINRCKQLYPETHEKIRRLSYKFKLASKFDLASSNTNELFSEDSITFDSTIFTIIYNEFWEKVRHFQLTVKPPLTDVLTAIKKRKANKKNKDSSLLVLAALLSSYHSLTELYKTNLIPERTYYRTKKELAEMGLSEKMEKFEFTPPPLDYEYYQRTFLNEHFKGI